MAKLGQEQLLVIFNALKKEVQPYECGYVKARFDLQGKYDLWSEKPGMNIPSHKKDELSFVALILQSSYVGFYYMPVYTHPDEIKVRLTPALLKRLKGKSCFHITSADDDLLGGIRQAMQLGYELYVRYGWI